MKKPVFIFYTITTLMLVLICLFQSSFLLPYVEVAYILFTFAESYYVLQNYDFNHGIPFGATIIKLLNTLIVMYHPLIGLIIHLLIHMYIYVHIRQLDKRDTRLKYDYTINNVIPGPFVLKLFAAFLPPFFFIIIALVADLRIVQKFKMANCMRFLKYIVLVDVFVLVVKFTSLSIYAFLGYMIMLIIFEFIEIEKKL